LVLESSGRKFSVKALNTRGQVLLKAVLQTVQALPALEPASFKHSDTELSATVKQVEGRFPEEERSQQHSIFSVVRSIVSLFKSDVDPQLGLYGAFGYDLTFQFEPIKLKHKREETQRDLMLYIPDNILVVDHEARDAWHLQYEYEWNGESTSGLPREGKVHTYVPSASAKSHRDHGPGEYAAKVVKAQKEFKVGNLFETVLSQTFSEPCPAPPSEIFRRLCERNPSPYGFIINLGGEEYLVGASPEMFVRVETDTNGQRVETCPISGTIRRGKDALEDHARIKEILMNPKEESELTMCTDVDRNDKSRICEAGSVQVSDFSLCMCVCVCMCVIACAYVCARVALPAAG
jgi:anthranilate synthase